MKAKVIKDYYDKQLQCYKKPNDTVEVDQQRLNVLENAKVAKQIIDIKSKEPKAE